MSAKKPLDDLFRGGQDQLDTRDELPRLPFSFRALEQFLDGESAFHSESAVATFRESLATSDFFEEEDLYAPPSQTGWREPKKLCKPRQTTMSGLPVAVPHAHHTAFKGEEQMTAWDGGEENALRMKVHAALVSVVEANDCAVASADGTVVWGETQIPTELQKSAASLITTSLMLSRMSKEQESSVCARFRGVTIKAVGFAGRWSVLSNVISDEEEERFTEDARIVYSALVGLENKAH